MRCRYILALMTCLLGCETSSAQGLTGPSENIGRPIVGSAGGARLPTPSALPGDQITAGTKVHLDFTGKPCVTVFGMSRPEATHPLSQLGTDANSPQEGAQGIILQIYDHTIIAQNHCSQTVKLKVCYYNSLSCIPVEVAGYARKEAILGVFPALRDFRYQYTERF